MPKPTQAEVAALVGRLRAGNIWEDQDHRQIRDEAAYALEALAGEGAEPMTTVVALMDELELARGLLRRASRTMDVCLDFYDTSADAQEGATVSGEIKAYLNDAPPAKPAGELPALPLGRSAGSLPERAIVYHADELRAYALRVLRERA